MTIRLPDKLVDGSGTSAGVADDADINITNLSSFNGKLQNVGGKLSAVLQVIDNFDFSSGGGGAPDWLPEAVGTDGQTLVVQSDGTVAWGTVQGGGGNSNMFAEDRLILDADATDAEPKYIIFKNGIARSDGTFTDGRLVWNPAGGGTTGELQIVKANADRTGTETHTLLHRGSPVSEYPDDLTDRLLPETIGSEGQVLQVGSGGTQEWADKQDISGIASNTSRIAANEQAISDLEERPEFQLSPQMAEFDSHLTNTNLPTTNVRRLSGFSHSVQLDITNFTTRAGTFHADGDNAGLHYATGTVTGYSNRDNVVFGVEFARYVIPASRSILELTYLDGNTNVGYAMFITDGDGHIALQRPGTDASTVNNVSTRKTDIQKVTAELAGVPNQITFTPAEGDEFMVEAVLSLAGDAIRFVPFYWDASANGGEGYLYQCDDIDFTTGKARFMLNMGIHLEHITIGGVGVTPVKTLKLAQHSGYESHGAFAAAVQNYIKTPVAWGTKRVDTSTRDKQAYSAQFQFDDQLDVPTKLKTGTLEVGDTELTEAKLMDLITALHIPENSVLRVTTAANLNMVADDVDKYVQLTNTTAGRRYTFLSTIGNPGDVVFLNNLAGGSQQPIDVYSEGWLTTAVRTLAAGETVPFVKILVGAHNSYWAPLVNFLTATAQGTGLNQTQVDARITALVQQFARDTTTRLGKGKLPTDTVYDSDISDFQTQSQVDARIATEARNGNTDRWPKDKLPTDVAYDADIPAAYTLPADLTALAGLDVAGNNNKHLWINGGNFAASGGYQQRRANYTCTIADDFAKVTGFVAGTGITRSVRMPDITSAANIGWYTTVVKDEDSLGIVRVNMNDSGDIIGASSDGYVTVSGTGDYIDLVQAGDSATFYLAGYQAGTGRTWWVCIHNLHRSKVPVRPSGNTTTRFLREDGRWIIPDYSQVSLAGYAQTSEIEDAALTANSSTRWTAAKLPTDVAYDADFTGRLFPTEVQAYTPSSNQAMVAADIGKYVALAPTADIRYTFNASLGSNGQVVWLSNQTGTAGNDVSVYGGVGNNHLLVTLKQNDHLPFMKINNVWVAAFNLPIPADLTQLTALDVAGNNDKFIGIKNGQFSAVDAPGGITSASVDALREILTETDTDWLIIQDKSAGNINRISLGGIKTFVEQTSLFDTLWSYDDDTSSATFIDTGIDQVSRVGTHRLRWGSRIAWEGGLDGGPGDSYLPDWQLRTVGATPVDGTDFKLTDPDGSGHAVYLAIESTTGNLLIAQEFGNRSRDTIKMEYRKLDASSTDLRDMPNNTAFAAGTAGQVLAKAASGGYELVDQTGGMDSAIHLPQDRVVRSFSAHYAMVADDVDKMVQLSSSRENRRFTFDTSLGSKGDIVYLFVSTNSSPVPVYSPGWQTSAVFTLNPGEGVPFVKVETGSSSWWVPLVNLPTENDVNDLIADFPIKRPSGTATNSLGFGHNIDSLSSRNKLTTFTSNSSFNVGINTTTAADDGDIMGFYNTGTGTKTFLYNSATVTTLVQYAIDWLIFENGSWRSINSEDPIKGTLEVFKRTAKTTGTSSVVLPEWFRYATSVTIASHVGGEFRYNSILVNDLLDSDFNATNIRLGGTNDITYTASTRTITGAGNDTNNLFKVSVTF